MAITPYVHPAPAPVVNVTVQPLVSPPDCREGSQHRRTGRLPPAQRHVRRLEQRPQPRDPLEGHRLAACPPNPLHDHRRRHLRELRQKSPDLRLEPIHSRTRAARTYLGGSWLVTAFFTAFREISSLRAIARIAIPSARCSLQISPVLHFQHPSIVQGRVKIHLEPQDQFFSQHRHRKSPDETRLR